jgi:sialate O-acetylesterase
MRSEYSCIHTLLTSFLVMNAGGAPLPFVNPIFGDNMVLQRGKPNALWGWSKPGDHVRVEIAGQSATTIAGPDGGQLGGQGRHAG